MLDSDKTMFEIYKESAYSDHYRVVYFTELTDHNKDTEIDRAFAGQHFYDGFIQDRRKEEAKRIIADVLARLNEGETVTPDEVARMLADHAT